MAFGAANWWALARGRGRFDELVRTWQKRLAVAVCALALFLALPIVDFGSISTRSQLARLERGKVDAERLDWAALAFDFGPAGRRALEQVKARGGRAGALAGEALATTNRWEASDSGERLARQDQARRTVRILSPDLAWNDDLARRVISSGACGSAEAKCALLRLDANRLLLAEQYRDGPVSTRIVRLDTRLGERHGMVETAAEPAPRAPQAQVDLDGGRAEVRTVQRRQLFVDGKPVGEVFE
jgi:hypothetical protein